MYEKGKSKDLHRLRSLKSRKAYVGLKKGGSLPNEVFYKGWGGGGVPSRYRGRAGKEEGDNLLKNWTPRKRKKKKK
jgi:hypothetical protein